MQWPLVLSMHRAYCVYPITWISLVKACSQFQHFKSKSVTVSVSSFIRPMSSKSPVNPLLSFPSSFFMSFSPLLLTCHFLLSFFPSLLSSVPLTSWKSGAMKLEQMRLEWRGLSSWGSFLTFHLEWFGSPRHLRGLWVRPRDTETERGNVKSIKKKKEREIYYGSEIGRDRGQWWGRHKKEENERKTLNQGKVTKRKRHWERERGGREWERQTKCSTQQGNTQWLPLCPAVRFPPVRKHVW